MTRKYRKNIPKENRAPFHTTLKNKRTGPCDTGAKSVKEKRIEGKSTGRRNKKEVFTQRGWGGGGCQNEKKRLGARVPTRPREA